MKHKKLSFTEREMIQYLYNENKSLKRANERLEKENDMLRAELNTYRDGIDVYDCWDEPAIGAPHGW